MALIHEIHLWVTISYDLYMNRNTPVYMNRIRMFVDKKLFELMLFVDCNRHKIRFLVS